MPVSKFVSITVAFDSWEFDCSSLPQPLIIILQKSIVIADSIFFILFPFFLSFFLFITFYCLIECNIPFLFSGIRWWFVKFWKHRKKKRCIPDLYAPHVHHRRTQRYKCRNAPRIHIHGTKLLYSLCLRLKYKVVVCEDSPKIYAVKMFNLRCWMLLKTSFRLFADDKRHNITPFCVICNC